MSTALQVAFRDTPSFVIDIDGFVYCAETANAIYTAAQGFGIVGVTNNKFRNRSTSVPSPCAGVWFSSSNGDYARLDLPSGPGVYEIGVSMGDASFGGAAGWDLTDGSGATIQSYSNITSQAGQYIDASGTVRSMSGFSYATETVITHTFQNDHVRLVRNTSYGTGNFQLTNMWVKSSTPSDENYNPFRNAKYINKTYQIPRFG